MNFKKHKTKLLDLAKSRTGVTDIIKIRIASQEEYAKYLLNNDTFIKASFICTNVMALFPVCVNTETKEILINPYDLNDARKEYWLGILIHELAHIKNQKWNENQCNNFIKECLTEEEFNIYALEESKIIK